jgi:hypothetical protein
LRLNTRAFTIASCYCKIKGESSLGSKLNVKIHMLFHFRNKAASSFFFFFTFISEQKKLEPQIKPALSKTQICSKTSHELVGP